jgi:16S rRNA (cytidine1402-2'-O)-methyltransferase
VVATPIGNLDDISLRALKVLAEADLIAAEDTRTTSRLLDHHHLPAKLLAVHQHNEKRAADRVLGLLSQRKNVALVSDAGTPAVSDPGAILVARAHAAGFRVTPIPGANAAIAALSAAGIAETPFLFVGFLPAGTGARRKALAVLAALPYTLVFFEAPHRVIDCVEDLSTALGAERVMLIARELTKLFEELHRCRLGEAAEWLRADPNRERGEFVLVVEGAPVAKGDEKAGGDWERVLASLLAELPLAQAVKLTCGISGARRNTVYQRALELSRDTRP